MGGGTFCVRGLHDNKKEKTLTAKRTFERRFSVVIVGAVFSFFFFFKIRFLYVLGLKVCATTPSSPFSF